VLVLKPHTVKNCAGMEVNLHLLFRHWFEFRVSCMPVLELEKVTNWTRGWVYHSLSKCSGSSALHRGWTL